MHLHHSELWRKRFIVWGAFLAAGIGELPFTIEYKGIVHNGLLPTTEKLSKEE